MAIIIGFSFGIFFFKKFDNDIVAIANVINKQVYAFQIGVFKNISNANKMASEENGIVISDKEYYRVYLTFANNEEVISKLKEYYDSKNINYYLKNIEVSDEFLKKLNEYELLMLNTDQSNYQNIINSIIKEYQNELQN